MSVQLKCDITVEVKFDLDDTIVLYEILNKCLEHVYMPDSDFNLTSAEYLLITTLSNKIKNEKIISYI